MSDCQLLSSCRQGKSPCHFSGVEASVPPPSHSLQELRRVEVCAWFAAHTHYSPRPHPGRPTAFLRSQTDCSLCRLQSGKTRPKKHAARHTRTHAHTYTHVEPQAKNKASRVKCARLVGAYVSSACECVRTFVCLYFATPQYGRVCAQH